MKNCNRQARRSDSVTTATRPGNRMPDRLSAAPGPTGPRGDTVGSRSGSTWKRVAVALGLMGQLTSVAGCAAGRFRYDELDPDQENIEMRGLDDLLKDADGRSALAPDMVVEQVEYDFTHERDEYRIGTNDVLNVFVMGHPEMSSQRVDLGAISGTTVRKDGKVYLPVVGAVPAAGLTLTEFEQALTERAAQYVVAPQVSTEMLEYGSQKFFVLGKVRAPGTFPVDGDTTLLEALGMAGGVDSMGNLESATLVREGKLMPINLADLVKRGDVSRNVYMRSGDLVFVPDGANQKVFVLGEVQNPRVVPIQDGRITLGEALAAAGGPTPARARRELAVIRGGFAKPVVYRIDLERALLVDDAVVLEPGDRVIVAPTGLSTASRYMQQILPFLLGAQAAGIAAQGATNIAVQAAASAAAAN